MNPRGIILSEFKRYHIIPNWEKIGGHQYKVTWTYDMPKRVADDDTLRRQWLNSPCSDSIAKYDLPINFLASSVFAECQCQEYYCSFEGNAAINGFGIDTFVHKNKNNGVKISMKQEISQLQEDKLNLENSILVKQEKIDSFEELIDCYEEDIEKAKENIEEIEKTLQQENRRLEVINHKINSLKTLQPEIYRIKALGNGRLYIELKNYYEGKKEGIIHFICPPFCNKVMGFEESLFQEAYICECETKIGWTLDKDTKIKINIKEFIPYFE